MSTELSDEFAVCDTFHKKLRYFNEMLGEMHSLLALEPEELKPTQEAEKELTTQLERHRAASESVAQARDALAIMEQLLAQVTAEMQDSMHDARILAEHTIDSIEARPYVRSTYKDGLRGIFETGLEEIPAPEATIESVVPIAPTSDSKVTTAFAKSSASPETPPGKLVRGMLSHLFEFRVPRVRG